MSMEEALGDQWLTRATPWHAAATASSYTSKKDSEDEDEDAWSEDEDDEEAWSEAEEETEEAWSEAEEEDEQDEEACSEAKVTEEETATNAVELAREVPQWMECPTHTVSPISP